MNTTSTNDTNGNDDTLSIPVADDATTVEGKRNNGCTWGWKKVVIGVLVVILISVAKVLIMQA